MFARSKKIQNKISAKIRPKGTCCWAVVVGQTGAERHGLAGPHVVEERPPRGGGPAAGQPQLQSDPARPHKSDATLVGAPHLRQAGLQGGDPARVAGEAQDLQQPRQSKAGGG